MRVIINFWFVVAVILRIGVFYPAASSAQQNGDRNGSYQGVSPETSTQSSSQTTMEERTRPDGEGIKGIVIAQSQDKTLKLLTKDGKEMSLKITKATKCKKPDSTVESECTFPKGSVVQITSYGAGRPTNVGAFSLFAVEVLLQSACKEDFCPKNRCKRKCGATKCVCSD